jgi:hypothetical protein
VELLQQLCLKQVNVVITVYHQERKVINVLDPGIKRSSSPIMRVYNMEIIRNCSLHCINIYLSGV